jgi:hypothetical protein
MATFGAVVLSALLHNVVSAVSGGEEPLFFLLALWVGPCVFIAAIIRAFRHTAAATASEPTGPPPTRTEPRTAFERKCPALRQAATPYTEMPG